MANTKEDVQKFLEGKEGAAAPASAVCHATKEFHGVTIDAMIRQGT